MALKLMCSKGEEIRLEVKGLEEDVVITVLFTGTKRCQLAIEAPRETVEIFHLRESQPQSH